jgi:hypothetical protein
LDQLDDDLDGDEPVHVDERQHGAVVDDDVIVLRRSKRKLRRLPPDCATFFTRTTTTTFDNENYTFQVIWMVSFP